MYYLANLKDKHIKASYKDMEDIPFNGFSVIDVPVGIDIDPRDAQLNPPRLLVEDVIRQKHEGLLAYDPYFNHVLYDDGLDPDTFSSSQLRGGKGRLNYWLNPTNGLLQTQTHNVSSVGLGMFDQFKIYWCAYTIRKEISGHLTFLYYERKNPDVLDVSISNDGGVSFKEAFFMERVLMPQAGHNLVVKFENQNPNERVYLNGFSILF
jgi:hypothetical protein